MAKVELIEPIHRAMLELAESRVKIKTIKDQLKDIAEQNDEWRALQDDLAELSAKRQTAQNALVADKDYQIVHSELEEAQFKHRDLQEILSHHLVGYFGETQEASFQDPEGAARQIIMQAKVGKPEVYHNQMNIDGEIERIKMA